MDIHLNFIVDQTQKYSNWLTEGLQQLSPTTDPSLSSATIGIYMYNTIYSIVLYCIVHVYCIVWCMY